MSGSQETAGLPVRSAMLKQHTGGLEVTYRWVTTSEYPLLYVSVFGMVIDFENCSTTPGTVMTFVYKTFDGSKLFCLFPVRSIALQEHEVQKRMLPSNRAGDYKFVGRVR